MEKTIPLGELVIAGLLTLGLGFAARNKTINSVGFGIFLSGASKYFSDYFLPNILIH
jgi:hypothetical protein